MDRTKYIPSIIALLAAFIACIVTIINKYETLETLLIVLATLIIFYIVGAIVRFLVNKILAVPEPEKDAENKDGEISEENSGEESADSNSSEDEEAEKAPEEEQVYLDDRSRKEQALGGVFKTSKRRSQGKDNN